MKLNAGRPFKARERGELLGYFPFIGGMFARKDWLTALRRYPYQASYNTLSGNIQIMWGLNALVNPDSSSYRRLGQGAPSKLIQTNTTNGITIASVVNIMGDQDWRSKW